MSKSITFGEKDKELIKEIEKYQKLHDMPSFVETVRSLCKSGLKINELIKNAK
jgi:hypothetical protein